MLQANPLKEIQAWLGLSNFNTTANIYAHLDTNVKQKSANVLSNILNGQKNTNLRKCISLRS